MPMISPRPEGRPLIEPSEAELWMGDLARRVSLCCECGTVRDVKSSFPSRCGYRTGGEYVLPADLEAIRAEDPERARRLEADETTFWRCIEILKCKTCDRMTNHAYLRNDAHRNIVDEQQARLAREAR